MANEGEEYREEGDPVREDPLGKLDKRLPVKGLMNLDNSIKCVSTEFMKVCMKLYYKNWKKQKLEFP
jgi:hypothetical protein